MLDHARLPKTEQGRWAAEEEEADEEKEEEDDDDDEGDETTQGARSLVEARAFSFRSEW